MQDAQGVDSSTLSLTFVQPAKLVDELITEKNISVVRMRVLVGIGDINLESSEIKGLILLLLYPSKILDVR